MQDQIGNIDERRQHRRPWTLRRRCRLRHARRHDIRARWLRMARGHSYEAVRGQMPHHRYRRRCGELPRGNTWRAALSCLLGKPGSYLATGMHGGVIYMKHELACADVPRGLVQEPIDEADEAVVGRLLIEYNEHFSHDLGGSVDASATVSFACGPPRRGRTQACTPIDSHRTTVRVDGDPLPYGGRKWSGAGLYLWQSGPLRIESFDASLPAALAGCRRGYRAKHRCAAGFGCMKKASRRGSLSYPTLFARGLVGALDKRDLEVEIFAGEFVVHIERGNAVGDVLHEHGKRLSARTCM